MFKTIKFKLYFVVAAYFHFFARVQLKRWHPFVIIITGSNGKTTTLHLVESQLKQEAHYSHFANSTFGIAFDILGLKRKSYGLFEWFYLFLATPFKAWRHSYDQKLYVVEADSDRPGEGKVLSKLLKPDVTIWLSSDITHSQNFDLSVRKGHFSNVASAIAYEFGYFLAETKKLVIINADNELIKNQLNRTRAEVFGIHQDNINYKISEDGSSFEVNSTIINFPYLLPLKSIYSIRAVVKLMQYLKKRPDLSFSEFRLPPGRSSILSGIKNTTIIDSSYNANYSSVKAILDMVTKISGEKWLILGDLIEQGQSEKTEHEKLVPLLSEGNFKKIILVGPRQAKYSYPKMRAGNVISFENPKDVLIYLQKNLVGGEKLIFKGARFLEGIIEHLLKDSQDVVKLCRQEETWKKTRKKWGL